MEDIFTLEHEVNRIIERLHSLCDKPNLLCEDQGKIEQGTVEGLLSIILPVDKDAKNFKTCIQNIRRHTAVPYEIVFAVNPLNQEKIRQYLKQKFCEKIDFRTVLCSENKGLSQAYNEGINKSRGEYIVLLTLNALVTKNWLPAMLMSLKRTPDSGVIGPMSNMEKGMQHAVGSIDISNKKIDHFAEKLRSENHCRRIPTHLLEPFCVLFSRKLFDSIGGFDEKFGLTGGAVSDFCLRALINGKTNMIAGDVYIHQKKAITVPLTKKYFKGKWDSPNPQSRFGKEQLMLKSIQRGIEAYQKDNFDEAIRLLIQGIQHSPDNPLPYFDLAEILLQCHHFGDVAGVIKEMPQAVNEIRKTEILGYWALGMGQDQDAVQYAKKAISLSQKSAPALNLLGLLALKQGKSDIAENFFNQAIDADPGYGEPYANLGSIFLKLTPDKALDYIERGFILSPHIPDILSAYHSIITDLGQYQRAETVFHSAVSAYPLNKILRYRFIDVLFRLAKYQEALTQIEESMALFGLEEGMVAAALKIREIVGPKEIAKAKKARKTNLSICMIVKDEEAFLVSCLHSVTPIADEIVVIDTGSTDRTKEIATIFGAKVYDFKWTQDFAAARNFSLSKANGDWIFVSDADEVISPLDHKAFLKLIQRKGGRPKAYIYTSRNYVTSPNVAGWTCNDGRYEEEEKGTGWHPSPKVRLFPNDKRIQFQNAVHEMVEPSLMKNGIAIKECNIPVHHYGQLDWNKYLEKGELYYRLGKAKLEETGEDSDALIELALATQAGGTFGKYEEALALWKRVLKIDPQNTKALLNMGSVLIILRDYNAALEVSETALKLDPGLKGVVMNYALCELLLGGDLGKVIAKLENLLKDTPDYPMALALLGSACAIAGERQKAVESMEVLGSQAFSRDYYLHDLSQKLIAAGQSQKAISLLQFALDSGNGSDDIRKLLNSLQTSRSSSSLNGGPPCGNT